ncbi:MAG: sulfatase-like hydrolase/transferase [Verrucomicrobia bacterium]|nr:sulfatase-like hydrolase/transferase [Verrucomicrobiota bacterium]
MTSTHRRIAVFALLAAFTSILSSSTAAATKKPNVVFILSDNHGAWTLGCYGNKDIRTPHIDKMAAEGVRFTNAFANNAVCSPTRATYLTGLMLSQHGVHNFLHGGNLQVGPDQRNTLAEFTSLPEVLKKNGYSCGLVGKWHLGNNTKNNEGLDDYWITMPAGGTSTFHGAQVIENGETRKEPEYLTSFWTKHALKFIDQSAKDPDKPFFLFLAYNGPYGLSRYQLKSSGNRHAKFYADKEMPSFPRGVIHPWEYNNREYFGNPVSIRRYGEELSAVDDGVGAVMKKLKDLGLDDDTLVIFAADQGWAGGQHGFWGMGDHTRPINAFDFSMKIPMIFRQPGKIPAGKTPDIHVTNYDFMPSVLSYLGMADQMPTEPKSPGRDFSNALLGKKTDKWDNTVFYEYESLRCVCSGDWKYIERFEDGYDELYNLKKDPGELHNLIDSEEARTKKTELKSKLDEFFAINKVDKYDLWNGGVSQPKTLVWGKEAKQRLEARLASGKGTIPSVFDPSFNPPSITLPNGYIAEVAAAPPLVERPMMATFDEFGRLFVCESSGVNLNDKELDKEKPHSIKLLEDTDNDGIFDKSTVFADKMTFPQGALWLQDSLYVMSPPSLWRLEDTTGDGVADVREELVTGFKYTGNAADVHGPFLHPNGRIYWCHGRKGHTVVDTDTGRTVSDNKGARIWSCFPDGSDIQVHAGGGMDNPVELDFMDNGDIVGSINLFYGRPRGDTLTHWIHGGVYPRYDQQSVIDEFKRTGPLLKEFHNFGHVAVSGMMRYRSGSVNPDWKDNIFTTHFNTQQITRTIIKQEGSTYASVKTEPFIKINDPGVHITDVLEDPNGDLLVIDTGGWFRQGCPNSQVARPDISGAIYRIRKPGLRDKKADQWGNKLDWKKASFDEVVHRLNNDSFSIREKASAWLAERGEPSIPALAEGLESNDPVLRRNSVWALCRLPFTQSRELSRKMLNDPDESVRQAAAQSAGINNDRRGVEALVETLKNDTAPVARTAAASLGMIGNKKAVPGILAALDREMDRHHEHALIYALIEINDYTGTTEALKSENPLLISRALWALDQMDSSKLKASDVLTLLDKGDERLGLTATQIAKRHPEWDGAIANRFFEWLESDKTLTAAQQQTITMISPAFINTPPLHPVIAHLLNSNDKNYQKIAFAAIEASDQAPLPETWIPAFKVALEGKDPKQLIAALNSLTKIKTDAFDENLRTIGSDTQQTTMIRIRALRAVSTKNAVLHPAAYTLLKGLLQTDSSPFQRLEASQMLGSSKLTKAQLIEIAGLTVNAGPMDLPHLIKAFEKQRNPEIGMALAKALPKSPGLGAIKATELQRLFTHYGADVTKVFQPTLDDLLAKAEQQTERLAAIEPELDKGDAKRGKIAFAAGKGACMTCHKSGDIGRAIGPELTHIGRIRTKRDLLESILYPSESLARDFESFSVTMKDGMSYFGLIQRETADSIYLTDPAGNEVALPRANVKSVSPVPVSIMPQGLEQAITRQELLDLIAFLKASE